MRALHPKRLWIPLVAIGVLLTAAGIWRGETDVILQKAMFICLECIGIG